MADPGGRPRVGHVPVPPGLGVISPHIFFHTIGMVMKSRIGSLRAVSLDATAPDGSTRDMLIAARDRLAAAIENPKARPRDIAPLTRRLMETVNEIKATDTRRGP